MGPVCLPRHSVLLSLGLSFSTCWILVGPSVFHTYEDYSGTIVGNPEGNIKGNIEDSLERNIKGNKEERLEGSL